MRDLATAVRKVSRVLWALHVTFQEVRPMPCALQASWSCRLLQEFSCGSGHALSLTPPLWLSDGAIQGLGSRSFMGLGFRNMYSTLLSSELCTV